DGSMRPTPAPGRRRGRPVQTILVALAVGTGVLAFAVLASRPGAPPSVTGSAGQPAGRSNAAALSPSGHPESGRPSGTGPAPSANHNGGAVLFERSGMLLVSLGDGGSEDDPQGNGQSLATLLGKVLRIDVSRSATGHPYAIPPDNPYADGGDGHRPEIWLSGL